MYAEAAGAQRHVCLTHVDCRRDPRRPRFCKRCQAWKPERAHHCSVLGRCVLKMGGWSHRHMCGQLSTQAEPQQNSSATGVQFTFIQQLQ